MFLRYFNSECIRTAERCIRSNKIKKYKITKKEISDTAERIAMVVRPSMQKDLEHITCIAGGNIIYSMWEGYLQKPNTKKSK